MSVNAIRALILLANVVLLGLIGWLCFDVFVTVDKDKYSVDPPNLKKYAVPEVEVNESQQKKELYKAISRVYDRPAPPPPKAETPAVAPPPDKADPRLIKVLAMNVALNPEATGSALIEAPLGKEPKYVQVGMDIGDLEELKAYKKVKVKAITEQGVTFLDQKSIEVKIPGPRGAEKDKEKK